MKSTPIIMPKAVKIERQFIMKVGLRLTLITLKKRNHWIKKSETSPGSKWGCWFNNKAPSLLFHWTVSSISWLIVRFLLSGAGRYTIHWEWRLLQFPYPLDIYGAWWMLHQEKGDFYEKFIVVLSSRQRTDTFEEHPTE